MARDSILSQLKRMRMSFRHSLKCGIPIHKEDILHEQSISQMGKYEQYIKNNIVPLRDPDPDARPTAKPTFGNPYKVGLCPRARASIVRRAKRRPVNLWLYCEDWDE